MKTIYHYGEPVLPNRLFWLAAILPAVLLGAIYSHSIAYMVGIWMADENYGHGFFVPIISAFLIWRKSDRLLGMDLRGSWWGLLLIFIGVGFYFAGELATLYVLLHLSLWIVLIGLAVSAIGWRGVKEIAFPLFYLLTMIPLPDFLYQGLSSRLQLMSSALGVGCLQVVGVTAFREGNVIDLGPIQLQVVEACSGLRYLFPLAALALICAYLFKGRMWKRIVLFLSSFPIAVFLNGFRIGMTGLLVDLYGKGPAEGFFHSFSGWFLFVCSLFMLLGEMWLLNRIGSKGASRPLLDSLEPAPGRQTTQTIAASKLASIFLSPSYLFSLVLFVPVLIASTQIVSRQEIFPARQSFLDFPMEVGRWQGKSFPMEEEYIKVLQFDDYILADYSGPLPPINFYAAYYRSQKMGQSAHSPRTCIPGGGWEITSLERKKIDSAPGENELAVNRAVIQKGSKKQVVFYWFQQRGRILTNEYLVKFYLFWDALTENRSDGALVRLTALIQDGESEADVDRRLETFAKEVSSFLPRYVPG